MIRVFSRVAFIATFFSSTFVSAALAQQQPAIVLNLDATGAPQKYYRVRESLPASPGAFTFVYPKWIPGYHGPVGPIEDVVNLHVSAGGKTLAWRRDLVDMYAVHVVVPPGTTALDLEYAVVGAESKNGQISPVSTNELALVEFSNFVSYAQGATAEGTRVDARVTFPAGWTFGTALPVASHAGDTVSFADASLYTLIDSPVIAGAHERAFPLGGNQELDVASDSAAGAAVTPKFLTGMRRLVAEGPALYGGKHYRDYHFLLTLSDEVGVEGIEHHESSDDRAGERYAADDTVYGAFADLLPHEYSHSWNGKYRRPADLSVPNYQDPEETDLLWIYEGLNQYNGEKLSTRAGLNDFQTQLDELADNAASMDVENGRDWRPIRDTADGAPFLYVAPNQYDETRRSAGDFYTEGDLIWLDADVTIRKLTHGKRSLDDFCKLWGDGNDTTSVPHVHGYDEATMLAYMTQVVPYDWKAFFDKRIAEVQPRAPLGGIENGGYSLVYTEKPNELDKHQAEIGKNHTIDARYSLGLRLAEDGTVLNIVQHSSAFEAGLAPGWKILAIDGRKFDDDTLKDALAAHKGRTTPMELIVANGDFFRTIAIDASSGERYPHLVRNAAIEDRLAPIYAPRTYAR